MCGRTCLTLDPQEIRCACKYTKGNKYTENVETAKDNDNDNENMTENTCVEPEWRKEYNCGLDYSPCYNIAPQSVTPVLVSSYHFSESDTSIDLGHERVIVPMLWGMIPFWHRGDYRKHGLTTNNCRLEHMLESKLYERPYRRGQRCVVLCEGFYEWQTTKRAKPSERDAFLLYMPQAEGFEIWNKGTWSANKNLKLLKLAGIFDVWTDCEGDKIFSYSIITFESSKIMSWLHHRMPAILETDQQIEDWLDYKRVPYKEALDLLWPATKLQWHQVSKHVNNSRNKESECNIPIEVLNVDKPKPRNLLKKWLVVRKRREDELSCNYEVNSDGEEEHRVVASLNESDTLDRNCKRPRYSELKIPKNDDTK